MRIAFTKTLISIAKKNKQVMLLTGDLGYSVFEEFISQFPQQFLNMGVAEQNMTGVAAGLATEGKIPFIYSIIPFVTMRNFEQIRNDICYQNLNVKIVGVGAGFSYGIYGYTHVPLEDVGILRTLPRMTIFSPGDPFETVSVVEKSIDIHGPVYIRLGKAGEPNVHTKKPPIEIGKGIVIKQGTDVTIFATGVLLHTAIQASELLKIKGISTQVISMPMLKPIDKEFIISNIGKTGTVFTLEEHSIIGGLGSAIAEILAEASIKVKFKRLGMYDEIPKLIGSQKFLRDKYHLSSKSVANYISDFIH